MKGAGSRDSRGDHRYTPKVSPQSALRSGEAFVELQTSDVPFCLLKKKKKKSHCWFLTHSKCICNYRTM